MISSTCANLSLPKPAILFDPCFALDELGLWSTARLQGNDVREIDVFLPARRSYRRVEVGHGEDAVKAMGQGSRQRLLVALDKALTKPLSLVIDPRRSDGGETILDVSCKPCPDATKTLATIVEAHYYTVSDYAVEFAIRAPRHDRLALVASNVFGPHMASLFSHAVSAAPLDGIVKKAPAPTPAGRSSLRSSLRLARYVRTATVKASGHNALEAQNKRINEHLAELGLKSTHNVVDEGCNGMGSGRSGIDTLLRLAERGAIDAVVATSADRFFRSTTQFDRLLVLLRGYGVSVMLVDHASTLGLSMPTAFSHRRGKRNVG